MGGKRKPKFKARIVLAEKQVVRIARKGTLGDLPVRTLGEVVRSGIGAKAKMWYGVRFSCRENPHGFMDLTMWEGDIRPLTKREAGRSVLDKELD